MLDGKRWGLIAGLIVVAAAGAWAVQAPSTPQADE
jgi:hypothetical protein